MARFSALLFAIVAVASLAATYNTVTTLYRTMLAPDAAEDDGIADVEDGGSSVGGRKPEWRRPGGGGGLAMSAVVRRPRVDAGPRRVRKYHTAMTCNESPYTKWQSRIMYFYYKKYQAMEGGEEMGGFTRVLHSGRPDNLMDEIPTYIVDPLPPGQDMGYVVLNRPWAFVQWIEKAEFEEEYVWMAEPDHIIMKPIPNLSTDDLPAAFPFFYITPKAMERYLRRWYPEERGPITNIDPIGNSPVIIRKGDLRKIAPLWMNISKQFKADPEIDKEFGWVQEMYAYATAAAIQGYTHILRKDFMVQPPWDTTVGDAYIIHYTYGCDYDLDGKFTPGKVGPWHFDKRDFQQAIPRNLSYPPKGAGKATFELIRKLNDATWTLDWQEGAL